MALNVTFEAEKRRAELNTSPETSESAAGAENVGVSRLFGCFCMFSNDFPSTFQGLAQDLHQLSLLEAELSGGASSPVLLGVLGLRNERDGLGEPRNSSFSDAFGWFGARNLDFVLLRRGF